MILNCFMICRAVNKRENPLYTTKDCPKWLFYTWVGHGKRPVRFALRSFTVANPGVKKPFWPVFYNAKRQHKIIDKIFILQIAKWWHALLTNYNSDFLVTLLTSNSSWWYQGIQVSLPQLPFRRGKLQHWWDDGVLHRWHLQRLLYLVCPF